MIARSSVVSSKAWQPRVKVALQRRPLLTMTLLNAAHIDGECDACKRAEHAAPHVVRREGWGGECIHLRDDGSENEGSVCVSSACVAFMKN